MSTLSIFGQKDVTFEKSYHDVTLIISSSRQSLPVYEEQSRIEYPYFDPQKIAAGSPSQDFEKADVK